MDDSSGFEFDIGPNSKALTNVKQQSQQQILVIPPPAEEIGQQPANYVKNFRKTVCTYWLSGMCMKGDSCGFLHQNETDRMPVCRNIFKYGRCDRLNCPLKHDFDLIKECNMYKLGFCIYGPTCRYRHIKLPGPPPDPNTLEAAKPRDVRDINTVV
eukprot:CAMPEP_0175056210 /NCGR_PEP_ID=MMETSP0052_2-20121109/10537_1 /TAXON_ID=51329 ORGANISM="Polytomella parva, Strain SAG 63-3" /NCGR_SAMPLE_ID=MMETSP0052_2 /ASSEMBLY_ACC=CAM_ASM_000194 /LENGTH=155 /DNA_ID=CAMNT_0016321197 /DNA_START=62 /DNA_END=526 /DNA_ORIENTATION=-